MSIPLSTVLQILGGATALSLGYKFYTFLHLYLRPSSLPRYLHGKPGSTWALVTGASDGIGYGFAEALLAQGFNLVIHGRNAQKLSDVKAKLSKTHPDLEIRIAVADAGDYDADVKTIASTCAALPGKLTVLINNVGGVPPDVFYRAFDDTDSAVVDSTINLNLRFPALLTWALLPLLKKNGPSLILNVGSTTGVQGMPYLVTYSAGKAFNIRFSETLELEMRADKADVEVLGILVGNVTSNSNRAHMAGVTCTSSVLAKSALDRVGCGYANVWAWWRHGVLTWLMELMPKSMYDKAVIDIMKDRQVGYEKELKGQ